MLAWNEFLFAVVLIESWGKRVLTIAIYSLLAEFVTEWSMMMAFSVLASAPLVIVHIPAALRGPRDDRRSNQVMTDTPLKDRPFDVVGFGVNALDLVAIIDGYPQPDTKVQFQTFDVQGGGVVATAMATCARLGLRARYIGKVGGDFWSHASLKTLAREGIDVRHVIRDKRSPGHVSIVLADRATGQRTLFFRRPPAYAIGPEELNRGAMTAGRLLHVDGIDAAAARQAIVWAREAGMRVTMDGERIEWSPA